MHAGAGMTAARLSQVAIKAFAEREIDAPLSRLSQKLR
jgi:hypothetical protein